MAKRKSKRPTGRVVQKICKARKQAFLVAYAQCGIVTAAAESSGASRSAVYRWLQEDPDFEEAFAQAGWKPASGWRSRPGGGPRMA